MSSDTVNIENYLKLIHQFPLRPIRSDAELDQAIQVIDSLLDRDEIDPAEKEQRIDLEEIYYGSLRI